MTVSALILAAGKGTRMKSDLAKVLHQVAGRPLVAWPVEAARQAGATRVALVVGHQAEDVARLFANDGDVATVLQEEQLGTGHAVACARDFLAQTSGSVLILCGDVPLTRTETLKALLGEHEARQAAVTVLTAELPNPFGYGRIIRRQDGTVAAIVEEKDATPEQKLVREINSGIYCIDAAFLRDAVTRISNDNAQREYYLTDVVKLAEADGRRCIPFAVSDAMEVMGVNDRVQLAEAAAVMRRRINEALMVSGVTLVDPATTYIEPAVQIGSDTIIQPNVHIGGKTVIGRGCAIDTGAVITDCTIGDGCHIKAGSVLEDSLLKEAVAVGPMAHLRPGTVLGARVKIGNFVETKKAVLGDDTKASHLTYLGDAEIGSDVNIGCGTITCNYDGVRKHKTVIEDGVFVGSDVQLVAPVKVGRNSLVAAGTTVTTEVPPDSLAISRVPQVNKVGWKLKKKD